MTNVDRNGDTIVTLCVLSNRIEILRLLFGRRMVRADAAKNVLLLVVEHATLDMINTLSPLSLEGWGAEATRGDGRLKEILEARPDYDEDLSQAWDRSLNGLRGTYTYQSDDTDEDDVGIEMEFEDALEH